MDLSHQLEPALTKIGTAKHCKPPTTRSDNCYRNPRHQGARTLNLRRFLRYSSHVVIAVLVPHILAAQTAVVARNVNLRKGHSSQTGVVRLLTPPDELILITLTATDGYYHVRLPDGVKGWVWGHNISIDTAEIAPAAPGGPPESYHGCDLEGTATSAKFKTLNKLKNRITKPAANALDPTATIDAILAPGPDLTRWNESQGASIVVYVAEVKRGADETVNCGETEEIEEDTHIELVAKVSDAGQKKPMIAEVTPRWREYVSTQGMDWTTPTLKTSLRHKWVRFTGWLMSDFAHAPQAENTNPGGAHNWRGTVWEIHPITEIKVCPNNSPVGC
jgi:uncharacterized protein YgiM (DUF1202 family)